MVALIGASPTPTPYSMTIAGVRTYLRCGADVLFNGFRHDLEAEARCPVCDRLVRFRMLDGKSWTWSHWRVSCTRLSFR